MLHASQSPFCYFAAKNAAKNNVGKINSTRFKVYWLLSFIVYMRLGSYYINEVGKEMGIVECLQKTLHLRI